MITLHNTELYRLKTVFNVSGKKIALNTDL